MKTYLSEQQIRLVGRVWEIRRYLKQAQARMTTDVSLLAFLSEQTGYKHEGRSSLMLDSGQTQPMELSHNATPSQLPHSSQTKKQDPQVIPFPSK
ncbi:Z-ring formation inhibitor MciZ [Paenibacillus sp. UNC451MF]|uniref:Z-ring formation inhibitor MciZ n=1 Tax=Paenibacillus sp. UNC451MF TaxID=1449063 RepID=UPI0018CC5A68